MGRHLTVIRDFGIYRQGARIEGEEEIAAILAGENAVHVVPVPAPDKPKVEEVKPAAAPASEQKPVA